MQEKNLLTNLESASAELPLLSEAVVFDFITLLKTGRYPHGEPEPRGRFYLCQEKVLVGGIESRRTCVGPDDEMKDLIIFYPRDVSFINELGATCTLKLT